MKNFVKIFFILLILLSLVLCFVKPTMHKPFSLNVIEYIIKFKNDGSTEVIKTVTTTTLEQNK